MRRLASIVARAGRIRGVASAALVTLAAGCDFGEAQAPAAPVAQCFRLADPYRGEGLWHRANFHMHSIHSDGARTGGELVQTYMQHGYSVLCITDHNQYGDQDGGIAPYTQTDSVPHDWNGDGVVHAERVVGSGVEAYVRDWNAPAQPWARDNWTRPELADWKEAPVVLSGAEATFGRFHTGLIGHPAGPIESPAQAPLYVARTRAAGGFVFLAHPGEANAAPHDVIRDTDLRQYHGIEIVNGLRLTQAFPKNTPGGKPDPANAASLPWDATPLWDQLLARGYRLWGMANDDSHTWIGAPDAYPFAGFNMVYAKEASEQGFLSALHRGALYGSTGIFFVELGVQDGAVVVSAPVAQRIRFIGWAGRVLQETNGSQATYTPHGREGYVRVEAWAEPAEDPWPRQAWSQPFWLEPVDCENGAGAGGN